MEVLYQQQKKGSMKDVRLKIEIYEGSKGKQSGVVGLSNLRESLHEHELSSASSMSTV